MQTQLDLPYNNDMYKDFEGTESFTYQSFTTMLNHNILSDKNGYITYLVDTSGYIDITPLSIDEFRHFEISLMHRPYLKVVWRYVK